MASVPAVIAIIVSFLPLAALLMTTEYNSPREGFIYTNVTISEIANLVGLNSVSYFRECFK